MTTYECKEVRGKLATEKGWLLPFIPVMIERQGQIVTEKDGKPLIIRREFRAR